MTIRRLAPGLLSCSILAAAAALAAPQNPPSSPPPSGPEAVEVRVHVTSGGRFQDDLKIGDFRLLEDGWEQQVASLALVRDGRVVRGEGGFTAPTVPRSYTLLFQAVDWDPKLAGVIDHLFGSVLKPGDAMTLVTPFKPYRLQPDALAARSKDELAKGMEEVLRKDITRGSGEYRDLISDLKRLTKAISGGTAAFDEDLAMDTTMDASGGIGLEMQMDRYRSTLMKLDGIRLVDENKLVAFAEALRRAPGQKTVVLFYQREYRPEISAGTMNRLMALYQENFDILQNLMELFQFYKRETKFDAGRVQKAFADAGIDFHFIFMEKKSQRVFGATMREQSEDIFPGFVGVAKATGGTAESSQNPAATFKHAADASSEYYLLTYVPNSAAPPGVFRAIEVQVGRGGCEVTNRRGYFSR